MDAESPADKENRTRSLWKKLDTQNEGFLDFKAFRKGLKKLDHREHHPRPVLADGPLTKVPIAALKNADGLIEDVLQAADINNSGRIEYDG
jgi:solute carrier family 25 phosphate transporter 23/24/25/41